MTTYQISTEVKSNLFRLFDEKQDDEISMVNDILPIIREAYLYSPMTTEALYTMNEIMLPVLSWYRDIGIMFCAIPRFEYDSSYGTINLNDFVYRKF